MNDFFDTRVRTDDVADTLAWLQAQYGHVDVQADDASFAEHAIGDGAFSLRHLDWDCRAEVIYEADRFFVATSTPGYVWSIGSDAGEYSVEPGIVQPGQELIGRPESTRLQLAAFDAGRLTETARMIYGDETLTVRFEGTAPVSRRMREYWLATLRWSLTQGPVMSEPLVRAQVYRSLAAATLETFALVGDPRERRASAIEQAAIYASATAWLDDHASLPITIDDAAAAVGASTEGLRRAFAANGQLAPTPEAYLAAARISAAHADLVAADAAVTTVAQVAARWGFTAPGRFAQAYRAAHRVDPQVVLDR
ncbi:MULTISPECIES: helix-turn-helix domain-containing protein [Microbacterium]|uniref:helix-turn-helix domain-containing protein n=1 Tax=Microbacterium TaxID=33882 RepID=UPI002785C2EC|nr:MULTISPECIES: helix-turn-helix domain-containing protein [Microbacterium]MDQ1076051.1 AraC-like DNA-binding protein [Microbacterium sp. SORGH_AS_0969]MDQ1116290.1 AraC-like DNA-binding protein [Microbacterium testaceum]